MQPPFVSPIRLNLLRGLYAFMAVGLALVVWPSISAPASDMSLPATVVHALLGGIGLLSLLGLRYPLRMIPLLLFELVWKLIWVLAYALPMWRADTFTAAATENLFACAVGIVLVPLALPWRHVMHHYLTHPGEPWRQARNSEPQYTT